jgi:hypothetical protein
MRERRLDVKWRTARGRIHRDAWHFPSRGQVSGCHQSGSSADYDWDGWTQSVVKMSGASYTAPSFRVRVEGASAQNATDDQVLWVKAQLPYPPLVDYVSASQQRRFDGTALADPAARVAAAHVRTTLTLALTLGLGKPPPRKATQGRRKQDDCLLGG